MVKQGKYSVFLMAAVLMICSQHIAAKKPSTNHEKYSYTLGYNMGLTERKLYPNLPKTFYFMGLQDALQHKKSQLARHESAALINAYIQKSYENTVAQAMSHAQTNLKNSHAFLAKNQNKLGVKLTQSGLQYKVLTKGNGLKPNIGSQVSIKFLGKKLDGSSIFGDSCHCNNLFISQTLRLNKQSMIAGWFEGIQLMQAGAIYRFFIPPHLAYGSQYKPNIEPNSVLIFDIALLDVMPNN